MVLVEFKSGAKTARFRQYSFGSIEKAIPVIKKKFKTQEAVACKVNGRKVFAIVDDKIIYG